MAAGNEARGKSFLSGNPKGFPKTWKVIEHQQASWFLIITLGLDLVLQRGLNKSTNFFRFCLFLVGLNPPNQERGREGHLAATPSPKPKPLPKKAPKPPKKRGKRAILGDLGSSFGLMCQPVFRRPRLPDSWGSRRFARLRSRSRSTRPDPRAREKCPVLLLTPKRGRSFHFHLLKPSGKKEASSDRFPSKARDTYANPSPNGSSAGGNSILNKGEGVPRRQGALSHLVTTAVPV